MIGIYRRIKAGIPILRRYARALIRDLTDADDLVQECVTRALTNRHLWREGTNLRAWLFTIVHNQYVNHVRRSVRTGTTVEFDDGDLSLRLPATQEKCLELRDLDRALGRLPVEQRTVILLVALEGMPCCDASAALGIPIGTVRSRLSRGRAALRELMDVGPDQRGCLWRNPRPCPESPNRESLQMTEDPRILELNIRHYQELLKLNRHTEETRQRLSDLLAEAQAQLPVVNAATANRDR
jgi:RNA polymerase sigma-70 factor, ECF subfamily